MTPDAQVILAILGGLALVIVAIGYAASLNKED